MKSMKSLIYLPHPSKSRIHGAGMAAAGFTAH
jgi:hypothetical protein